MFVLAVLTTGFISVVLGQNEQLCFEFNFTVRDTAADITIMLDTSSSLTADQFNMTKSILSNWARGYSLGNGPTQVQFGFVSYNLIGTSYGFYKDVTSQDLFDTILAGIPQFPTQTRNAYAGYAKALDNLVAGDLGSGSRTNVPHVCVVFSGNLYSLQNRPEILDTLRRKYELVLAVGLTPDSINSQIDQLTDAAGTSENVYFLDGPANLKYIVPWLVRRVGTARTP